MAKTIQLNNLYDSGSHYSSYWEWGPVEILIEEIAAVGKTDPSFGKSLVVLRSGKKYHCKENPSDILDILRENGWEEPIKVKKVAKVSAA